jgi:hypothetical protein
MRMPIAISLLLAPLAATASSVSYDGDPEFFGAEPRLYAVVAPLASLSVADATVLGLTEASEVGATSSPEDEEMRADVPLPAGAWMLLSALGGAGFCTRRKRGVRR